MATFSTRICLGFLQFPLLKRSVKAPSERWNFSLGTWRSQAYDTFPGRHAAQSAASGLSGVKGAVRALCDDGTDSFIRVQTAMPNDMLTGARRPARNAAELDRALQERAHDPIKRRQRLVRDHVITKSHREHAGMLQRLEAAYREKEDLILVGAYQRGSNPLVDAAIDLRGPILDPLQQPPEDSTPMDRTVGQLAEIGMRGVNATLFALLEEHRWPPIAAIHAPARTYTPYDAMLDDPEIDAIIIGVADQYHVALAQQAIAAGKHVLVEKPLGVSVEECEALRASVAAAGLVFQVGNNRRFDPGVAFAHTFIREQMGQVMALKAWYYDSFYRYTMTDNLQPIPLASACLLYTSPSPRARTRSLMPSPA